MAAMHPEVPATGLLDTGPLGYFTFVFKQMTASVV
jgi:hypothetical protein